MSYIILGDVHLGKGLSAGKPILSEERNSRIADQLFLLNWVLDCAIKNNCDRIIITGDIYDDYRPYPTIIKYFMRWVKKCEESNIIVDVIAGNHDIVRNGTFVASALDLIPELKMTHASFFKDVSVIDLPSQQIVLLPFRDRRMYEVQSSELGLEKLKEEIYASGFKKDKRKVVVIGHFALESSIPVGDEIANALHEVFLTEDFLSFADYVFMGHIHHHQVMLDAPGKHVAHIGSMDRTEFSETEINNDKFIALVSEDSFEYIKLPNRPLRKCSIDIPSGKDSTEYLINQLCLLDKKEPFKNSIAKIEAILAADVSDLDRDKVISYLCDNLETYHICSFLESRMISVVNLDPELVFDTTMNIASSIDKFADTRTDFSCDEEKEEFKKTAHECRAEYEGLVK